MIDVRTYRNETNGDEGSNQSTGWEFIQDLKDELANLLADQSNLNTLANEASTNQANKKTAVQNFQNANQCESAQPLVTNFDDNSYIGSCDNWPGWKWEHFNNLWSDYVAWDNLLAERSTALETFNALNQARIDYLEEKIPYYEELYSHASVSGADLSEVFNSILDDFESGTEETQAEMDAQKALEDFLKVAKPLALIVAGLGGVYLVRKLFA